MFDIIAARVTANVKSKAESQNRPKLVWIASQQPRFSDGCDD